MSFRAGGGAYTINARADRQAKGHLLVFEAMRAYYWRIWPLLEADFQRRAPECGVKVARLC